MSEKAEHWDRVYSQVADQFLGWYEPEPTLGLSLIDKYQSENQTSLFIAGGGTTNLIDQLVDRNNLKISFADISQVAIDKTKDRLGSNAENLNWICQDLSNELPASFNNSQDLWYDRAVFHFIIDEAKVEQYLTNLHSSLKENGKLIIGVFSDKTAKFCSGLPVQNYSPKSIESLFEKQFSCLEQFEDEYTMPSGDKRLYLWSIFQKK